MKKTFLEKYHKNCSTIDHKKDILHPKQQEGETLEEYLENLKYVPCHIGTVSIEEVIKILYPIEIQDDFWHVVGHHGQWRCSFAVP